MCEFGEGCKAPMGLMPFRFHSRSPSRISAADRIRAGSGLRAKRFKANGASKSKWFPLPLPFLPEKA